MTREEAIKVAYGIAVTKEQHEALQFLIPELCESEDEKIRKEMIEFLNQYKEDGLRGVDITPWIAYLEKQKEQQSEVDLEKELDKFYGMYRKGKAGKTYDIEDGEECVDWKEMCNPYFEIEFARHFYELGKNSK